MEQIQELTDLKYTMQKVKVYLEGKIEQKKTDELLAELENATKKARARLGGVKRDCFAYREGKCLALSKLVCKKEACPFYKVGVEFYE